jgi:hypothetical protein
LIKQEALVFDAEFFAIFSRLLENALAAGQEELGKQLEGIQQILLSDTEYGKRITNQYKETQEAIKTLQAAGKSLDLAKLLEILIDAPNEDRLKALVGMTRPGLDYQFFQELSGRIEKQSGEERTRMEKLRSTLLELTRQIDNKMEEEVKHATSLLEKLLGSNNIQQATQDHLQELSEIFIQVLNQALQEANQKNDAVLMPKLQQIVAVLQKASAPPPELEFLEDLLQVPDEAALHELLEANLSRITPEFIGILGNIIARSETEEPDKANPEEAGMLKKIQLVYKMVLQLSMRKNMQ